VKKLIVAVSTLIVFFIVAGILHVTHGNITTTSDWQEKRVEGTGPYKISQIHVEGQIVSGAFGDQIISQLNAALEDDLVKGVVLYIDSPGGDVVTSDNIYRKLVEIKKSGKKIVVSMGAIAASGGYYIATAADQIFANPSTVTGSIGVVISFPNYQGLGEKLGISSIHITSGENKVLSDPWSNFSDRAEQIYRNIVEDSFEQFVQVVMDGRKMRRDKVLSLADGRVYSGKQAKNLGLVDQFGSLEDATEYLKNKLKLSDVKVIRYTRKTSLLDGITNTQSALDQPLTNIIEEMITATPKIMYILR
jgi:protease-4